MNILQIRDYKANCTEGDIYIDGNSKRFCRSLEDVGRPLNVKVDKETCIPEGCYTATVTMSNRFKKDMILLYNMPDKSIERNGVRFTGIRVHGVTGVQDTEGCIGAMYNVSNGKGSNRASDDLCELIRAAERRGETVRWTITS